MKLINQTYIIAEAGVNHNGSMKYAARLIAGAKKAGANAIKFKNFISENLVTKNETKAKVFSVDLNDKRLLEAKELGSDYVVNPTKINDVKDFIYKQTNGKLLDLVIECSGNINALEKSLGLINNSGIVKFATLPKFGDFLKIDPFELILGKKIEGSWGGGVYPDTHLPLIASKTSQNIKFCNFYKSKFYSLEDINLAFDDLRTGKVLRPVIAFKEI